VLSPAYAEALANLPGWDQSARARAEEARWRLRLSQLTAYVEAGNDWPRHKDTDSEQERVLGVWLHIQRYKRRRRELDPVKAELLDRTAPGWREGRRPSR
jgi:hypothetical protein